MHRVFTCVAVLACAVTAVAEPADTTSANDALKRCKFVATGIERIRQKRFKRDLNTDVQTPADFRIYVTNNVAKQFGSEGSEGYTRALVKMGLLQEYVDITEMMVSLAQSQAAAYYDPERETYFLLMTNMPSLYFDIITSHELCHGLQDQYYDLAAFMWGDPDSLMDNQDRAQARQSLIEGEATWVMTVWSTMEQLQKQDLSGMGFLISAALRVQANMDLDTLLDLSERQVTVYGDECRDLVDAVKASRDLPRFFLQSLFSAYTHGALMVDEVKAEGGWEAVDALFENPPESTEQVLHPEKLTGKRESPVDVRLPDLIERMPESWTLREQDVLGELGIRILLQIWRDDNDRDLTLSRSAAAGWGGDRYYYFEGEHGKSHLLVWKTVWDTPSDAMEFMTAYRMMAGQRFPGMKKAWRSSPESASRYQVWEVEPGRFLKLTRQDKVVGILDTTNREFVDIMWD